MHSRNVISSLILLFCIISCQPKNPTVPTSFHIQPGFDLTLVASEPLLQDPVDLEFDEHGNIFVLEMPGYPMEDQQSYIVQLIDSNNDGLYDERKIIAEHLNMATSIMPYSKGILVAAPPYLLHLKDLNHDGLYHDIDTLMGGFSTGNLQHNYNGLMSGLDGWIYAANGGNSGVPFWWGDTTTALPLRGRDFRFNLQSKTLERLGESSGGFGLTANEWGHLFETHNLNHISHLVFPERYHHNLSLPIEHALENISDHDENGLSRIYPIGEQESRVNHPEQSGYFSGACGITYYGGAALGEEMDQTIWIADVVLNLIHIDKLNPNVSSYAASRVYQNKDFLASNDRSFRPVNMSAGPDGSMYIVDMYREVIEHPEWIPDEMENKMDLNAGKDKGRIYKVSRSKNPLHKVDFGIFKTNAGCIDALKHSNQWIRKTAHRLLLETKLNTIDTQALYKLILSSDAMAKSHALWVLHFHNMLNVEILYSALQDQSPEVREQALLLAEQSISDDDSLMVLCSDLLSDTTARVRMQAALTLSTLPAIDFKRHLRVLTSKLMVSSSLRNDQWNNTALTLAAQSAPANIFKQLIDSNSKSEVLLNSLARISGQSIDQTESVLICLAQNPGSELLIGIIIQSLAAGIEDMDASDKVIAAINDIEQQGPPSILPAMALLRKKMHLPNSNIYSVYSKDALKLLANRTLSDSIRLLQLQFIELIPYSVKASALYECLNHTQPLTIQEAALRQLSTIDEPAIGLKIVEMWPSLGPHIRKYAGDLLLYKKMYHEDLLDGLEQKTINIGEMNFDLERRRTLLWWTDNERTKKRAQALFSDEGVTTRKEVFEKMKPALTLTGLVDKGAVLFQNTCSPCHIYGPTGKDVGPNLTEISRKSKETIMHDIIDPNAAVETKYINHKLETNSGEVQLGMIDVENDQTITIKQMGGSKILFQKSNIKHLTTLGTSLMMEGLEHNMTHQDMADLLAYLRIQ